MEAMVEAIGNAEKTAVFAALLFLAFLGFILSHSENEVCRVVGNIVMYGTGMVASILMLALIWFGLV